MGLSAVGIAAMNAPNDKTAHEAPDPKEHIGLVYAIAKGFHRDHSHFSLDDLAQEGNLGLMIAIERFDPTRGCQFSTYAAYWIKNSIRRAVSKGAQMVRRPTSSKTNASPDWTNHFSPKERGQGLNRDDRGIEELMHESNVDPGELIDKVSEVKRLASAMAKLKPIERIVLRLRYSDEESLAQVGARFDLSRERIRQIQLRALGKLRATLCKGKSNGHR